MGCAATDPRATTMPKPSPLPSRLRRPRGLPAGRFRAPARVGPGALALALGFMLAGCGQQPPARDTDAIAINVDPGLLRREYASVRRIGTFENGLGVTDDEEGAALYLAAGLRPGWGRAWPRFRDFS